MPLRYEILPDDYDEVRHIFGRRFLGRQGYQLGGGLTLSFRWIFARLVDLTNGVTGFIRRIGRRRTDGASP